MSPIRQPQRFEPLKWPLNRSALIEASAGTGKTFAIAQLYLRLVLGHGAEGAFERPLSPDQILVMTFTDAATRELRSRIRQRLVEASRAFSAAASGNHVAATADPLLAELVSHYAGQLSELSKRLEHAASGLDQATVSTLHGWCASMLREHAFDSGSPFDFELDNSHANALRRAALDYWRTHIQPLSPAGAAVILRHWRSPKDLHTRLRSVIDWSASLDQVDAPAAVLEPRAARMEALRLSWREWADEFEALVDHARSRKQLLPRTLARHHVARRLNMIRAWAAGGVQSAAIKELLGTMLSYNSVSEAWGGQPPDHPAIQSLAELEQLDSDLDRQCRLLYSHAARWCADKIQAERHASGRLGFHDLLTRLDQALQGPHGPALAATIRTQFPVALVDEFQDTDPLQFRMLQAIYPFNSSEAGAVLLMVGDPKQAIYGFRGADIHTYIRARALAGAHFGSLDTNHRSSQSMVRAVNCLFSHAESGNRDRGAFLMGPSDSALALPFTEVQAAGRKEQWVINGQSAPALTFWRDGEATDKTRARAEKRHAAACADAIATVLHPAQGETGFLDPKARFQPARASDIAVLVNNLREATLVREALQRLGIRSVYLSERESVFQSCVAADLQRWLEACAAPADDAMLRAALASNTLGIDLHTLEHRLHDEAQWEAIAEQFAHFGDIWRSKGILPMLTTFVHEFGVARTLLATGRERDLTDLLHLAEWLQEASTEIDGEQALIRHFEAQRLSDEDAQDNPPLRLRLESDRALVKVVSVHKSKGLEYPLVFLPFAWASRAIQEDDCPIRWHDDSLQLRVATVASPEALQCANTERLAEDIRKFYVAITRARHAVWMSIPPDPLLANSALGHLLIGGAASIEDPVGTALAALVASAQGCVALAPPQRALSVPPASVPPTDWRDAPAPPIKTRRPWWITSFTNLASKLEARIDTISALDDVYAQCADEAAISSSLQSAPGAAPTPGQRTLEVDSTSSPSLESFPRGAQAGSFLHSLLEWMGAQGFHRCAALPNELDDLIARRCNLAGYERWIPSLQRWLRAWLNRPIPIGAPGRKPAPLIPAMLQCTQVELEFWLPIEALDTRALDMAVRRHTVGAAPRPALNQKALHGMLRGFVDLCFEHDGRYFVLDYKSNHLGDTSADYHIERLRDSVLEHRYDLQSALYLFALHRLLRARLGPQYDYDQHVGGALILFIRGYDGPAGGLFSERPPRALMEELEALFAGHATDRYSQSAASARSGPPL